MAQNTIGEIVAGIRPQKPIALCFGFEHSPLSTDSFDRTGAPVLLNILLSGVLQSSNGYVPLVISSSSSCEWIRERCEFALCMNKREIEQELGFDNKSFVDYEWVCSILSELEMLSLRRAYFGRMSGEERRYQLIQKIRFWASIFDNNDIEIYINSNVPHLLDDYIAYRFARYYRIPVVCAYRLPIVPGVMCRLMFFRDPLLQCEPLCMRTDDSRVVGDLSSEGDLRNLYDLCVAQGLDLDKTGRGTAGTHLDGNWGDGRALINQVVKTLDGMRQIGPVGYWKNQRAYLGKQSPVPKDKYVYFPLHFQPEASSRPLGGLWADQEMAVETISQALPKDVALVVKEHPIQHTREPRYRTSMFYEKITTRPNVYLVPAHLDSGQLIRESTGIVTLTGTAALEGIMKKKPCCTLGTTPLQRGPGVCAPRSFEELEQNLKRLSAGEDSSITDMDIRKFFVWLADHSVVGYLEPYTNPKMGNELSEKGNIEMVSEAFKYCIEDIVSDRRADECERNRMGVSS